LYYSNISIPSAQAREKKIWAMDSYKVLDKAEEPKQIMDISKHPSLTKKNAM
jgi:hypothetical protein